MIVGNVRSFSEVFGYLQKSSCGLRKSLDGSVRSSEIFGRFRTIFCGLRNTSVGLRQSSSLFVSLRFNFGNLCNLHSCLNFSALCYTFLHYVNKKCTFSQSELSNFFKCIISRERFNSLNFSLLFFSCDFLAVAIAARPRVATHVIFTTRWRRDV